MSSPNNTGTTPIPFHDISNTNVTGRDTLSMSSPRNNGATRRPFHDISNTNPEGNAPSLDPKELKSQRNKEYYARNRDTILRRRREALEQKQASAALLKDTEMSPRTPIAKAQVETHGEHTPVQDIGTYQISDTNELKRQRERERYSENRDDILKRKRQAYSDINVQQTGTRTTDVPYQDPKERRKQRDRERYARNRYEILNQRHQAHQNKESPAALINGKYIVTHTPPTGQSVLTQLQQIHAAGLSNVPNSSAPPDTIMHGKENINYHEEASWLHRNDAYQMHRISGRMRAIGMPLVHNTPTTCNITVDATQGLSSKDNVNDDEESDWLRRNDTYQMQEISGRRRAVLMPSGQNQQNKSTVIRDSTQGLLTQLIEVQTPQLNQESDKRRGMEESPDAGQPDNYERNDETDDVYGIFEPAEHPSESEEPNEGNDADDDLVEEEETLFREHVEYESVREERQAAGGIPEHDSFDSVYRDLPREHHVLRKVRDCGHCEATRFQYEGPAFCCRKGKIRVFIPDVPEELKRLWTSQDDDDAKYFRENIRGLSGYLVFNFMHSYHNERLHYSIPTGNFLLKRRFLAHILKHELNEVVDNISPEERDILDRIEKWTFTDLIE